MDETVRYRAHFAVRLAVADGRLPRAVARTCAECAAPAHHYHHYRGYEQEHWLDVLPVCRSCHPRLDAQQRKLAGALGVAPRELYAALREEAAPRRATKPLTTEPASTTVGRT